MCCVTADCGSSLQQIFECCRQAVVQYQHCTTRAFACGPLQVVTTTPSSRDELAMAADRQVAAAGDEVAKAAAAATLSCAQQTSSPSGTGGSAHVRHHCRSARRRHVLFSRAQTVALEAWFRRHNYVSAPDRDRLAASLALRPAQVKIWFQNRRYKLRKVRRQMERDRDPMTGSSAITVNSAAAAAAAATSLQLNTFELRCHRAADGSRPVVRRIAVPILVRDDQPCSPCTLHQHSLCQTTDMFRTQSATHVYPFSSQ